MRRRRMSDIKVIRWILLRLRVGVKKRMVEAAEEEISARQEMSHSASERKVWQDGRGGALVIEDGEQGNSQDEEDSQGPSGEEVPSSEKNERKKWKKRKKKENEKVKYRKKDGGKSAKRAL